MGNEKNSLESGEWVSWRIWRHPAPAPALFLTVEEVLLAVLLSLRLLLRWSQEVWMQKGVKALGV